MTRRVVQFSTGHVGRPALAAIIARPDLELVGVHASSPDKVGKDAAELAGLGPDVTPTGVLATDDLDALVALKADVVVYTTQAETRPQEALAEVTAFLRAGTDVVGSSFVWLLDPASADAWLTEPIEAACREGGSTMYVNGIDPGFSGDTLALAALSLAVRADEVRVQEICDYGSYPDPDFTGVSFGFGQVPGDEPPMLFLPGVLTSIWGGSLRLIARCLDVEVEEVREFYEPWVTPEPIDCTMMRVEPGQTAAVRFGIEGYVGGRPRIVVEHVNRLTAAAAPDWAFPPEGRPGVHRVVVSGSPGVEINTHVGLAGVDHNDGGVIATAARVLNAIDAVCDAPPGLIGITDLPASYAGRLVW